MEEPVWVKGGGVFLPFGKQFFFFLFFGGRFLGVVLAFGFGLSFLIRLRLQFTQVWRASRRRSVPLGCLSMSSSRAMWEKSMSVCLWN